MKYILVSACLLGINCRYDGKSNENPAILALQSRDDITLIPVCPEQLGGLTTPRAPSERSGNLIKNNLNEDVTGQYSKGAQEALRLAKLYGCKVAILKERSPSCGCRGIYDGTFSHTLVEGQGVTAELLSEHGITVLGESFPEIINI